MRQVPAYLIIGRGRLARHLLHYFSNLGISCQQWHRELPQTALNHKLKAATHVWILINDLAIEPFIEAYLQHSDAYLIHCSGSLVTDKAIGVHPLMTFADSLYDSDSYAEIPFVIDETAPDTKTFLPQLPNPTVRIKLAEKARYHALCVMAGNFSCLLWQKLLNEFEGSFKWPKEIAHPYMQQQFRNLMTDPEKALTGPLVRQDGFTINKNLQSLDGDPFKAIYQSFVAVYQQMQEVA